MFGHAKCHIGFEGETPTIKDPQGEEGKGYNVIVEATYRFVYVKDDGAPGGYRMSETKIYADPMPAVQFMLQKGIVSAKDLGMA